MKRADCRVRVAVLLGIVAGVLTPAVGRAQADRYAGTVLQIASTPRASTFGSAAAARDIEAIFGNPALVGVAVGTVAAFGRFAAATHVTLASSSSLGPFSIGIGAQYLDYVSQTIGPRYWSYALQVGGYENASSAVGALALSANFRGNRVGAAMKYIDQRQGRNQDGAPSLDLGLSRDFSRYTVGVTVQNIGDGIHFESRSAVLPLRVAAGLSSYGWTVGPFDVNGAAGASVLPDGIVLPSFGLELGYVPLEGYNFAVRAGIRRPELRAQQPLSFGGSAALDRFALEYAYEDWQNGGTHRLALRVR